MAEPKFKPGDCVLFRRDLECPVTKPRPVEVTIVSICREPSILYHVKWSYRGQATVHERYLEAMRNG